MKKKLVYMALSADIIHPGHCRIIKKAAEIGKVTIGLLTDKAICSYKRLPYMNYQERLEVISNLVDVDSVIPQDTLDYRSNLLKLKPDYVVHGDDWREGVQQQTRQQVIDLLQEWGGELIEFPYTEGISSSKINEMIRIHGITPERRRASLRKLILNKKIVKICEAHNGLTGLMVERNGFEGIWCSSLTDSLSKGKPDIEAVDITSRIKTVNEILEVTTKPIIFDADTGGLKEHFCYTVRTLDRLGVSAVIIEDKIGLKQNSLYGNEVEQLQASPLYFAEKIKTGKKAQISDDFMIIARIESLILNKGIDDALKRANIYINAGADGIMIHSKDKTDKNIMLFCRELKKDIPIIIVPTTYNNIPAEVFSKYGVNVIIYANQMIRAAIPAMQKVIDSILNNDCSYYIERDILNVKDTINFAEKI